MSSPLSSLKKTHKLPLSGHRPIPFRDPHYTDDENKLLDEITTDMATKHVKERNPFLGGLPKQTLLSANASGSTVPSDSELMSLMINRVSLLEQRVQYQNREIAEKDKMIKILEDKVQILQKAQASSSSSRTNELEKKCLQLQQQVYEMESFLADYGMVWVGDKTKSDSSVYNSEKLSSSLEDENTEIWISDSSISQRHEFKVDYDQIIENIRDLNTLAGEGVAKIQHTTDGARLKIPKPVPLTLYANGIVLFSGPFRSFSDPTTQQCVQDLLDGYFPSELQSRYPDGIPFIVTDMRYVTYERNLSLVFTGTGQILGGETKPSRLVPSNLDQSSYQNKTKTESSSDSNSAGTVTNHLPGQQMTVQQFLERLPKSVLKEGRLIDIRDSVGEALEGSDPRLPGVTVCDTEVTAEMKKRLENTSSPFQPSSPHDITTLRIKSESGDHTYIVKMKFTETIGDLRKYLNKERKNMSNFKITTAYPKQTYDDESATLEECGLTPNAVLLLQNAI